jgi:hypothetical protein
MFLTDKVYRLLTRKTYEMHMFHRASLKLGLDRAVLQHMRNENEQKGALTSSGSKMVMQTKEIDELLKRGAYDIFREDDSEAEQVFKKIFLLIIYTHLLKSQASRSSPKSLARDGHLSC